jgi:hypothetical protein
MGKKRALDRFFGSLFQNQQGFGTGSIFRIVFIGLSFYDRL